MWVDDGVVNVCDCASVILNIFASVTSGTQYDVRISLSVAINPWNVHSARVDQKRYVVNQREISFVQTYSVHFVSIDVIQRGSEIVGVLSEPPNRDSLLAKAVG
jgi:hypothetical protein